MADLPSLVTRMKMETSDFDRATDKVMSRVKELNDRLQRTFQKMEDLGKKAALGFGAVSAGLAGLVKVAGDAETAQRKLEIVTKDNQKAYERLYKAANDLAKSPFFSKAQAQQAMANAYAMGKNYEFTAEQVEKIVNIAADLGAIYGFDLPNATERLMAAMRGEAESAEMLGLSLSQTAVQAWALENGIQESIITMDLASQAQVRYQMLLDVTKDTMGASSDMADTFRGALNRLKNSFLAAAQNVGGTFLDDAKNVLNGLSDILNRLSTSEAFGRLVNNLTKIALTITGVGVVIGLLGKTASVVMSGISMAVYMATTPWLLFTVAAVTGAVLVINNWEKIKETWDSFVKRWNSVDASPEALAESWKTFTDAIKTGDWSVALDEGINLVIGGVKFLWEEAGKILDENNIKTYVNEDWNAFTSSLDTGDWLGALSASAKLLVDVAWGAVTILGETFSGIAGVDNTRIQDAINDDFLSLRSAIETGDVLGSFKAIGRIGVDILWGAINFLGSFIDGFEKSQIKTALDDDLKALKLAINSGGFLAGLKATGKIMVDIAWGIIRLAGQVMPGFDAIESTIDEDFQELRKAIDNDDFLSGVKAAGKISVDIVWGVLRAIGKPLSGFTGDNVLRALDADFQGIRNAISTGNLLEGVKATGQVIVDILWGGLNLFGSLLEAFGVEDVKSRIAEKIVPLKEAIADGDILKGLTVIGSLAVDLIWGGVRLAGQALSNVSEWVKKKASEWLYGTGGFRGGRIPDVPAGSNIGWIDLIAAASVRVTDLVMSGLEFAGGVAEGFIFDFSNWVREKLGVEKTLEANLGNDLTVILTGAIKGADIGFDWLTDKMSGLNEKLKEVVERLRNADVGKVGLDVDAQAMSDELTNFGKTLGEFVVEGFKLSVNLTDIVASAVGNAVEGLTGSEALGMVAEKGVPLYFVAKLTGLDKWAGQILQTLTFAGIVRGGSGVGSMLKSGLSAAALTMSVALVMDRVENAIAAGDLKSAIKDLALAAGIGIAGAALGGPLGGLLAFSISLYIIPKLFSDDRTVDQLYADLQDKAVAMQQALESPSIVPATYLGQVYDQIAPIQDLLVKMKDESVYERLTPMMQNEIAKLEAWVVTVVDIFNKISDGLLEVDEAIRKLKGDKTPIIVPLDVTTGAAPERSSFKEQVPLDLLPLGVGVDIGPNPFHYGAGVGLDSRMASLSPVQVVTIPEAPTGEAFSQTYINELASTLEKLVQQTEVKEPARVVGAMETSEKLTYADVKGFSLGKVDPMVLFAWAMAESDSLRLNQVSSDNLGLGPWQFGRSTWEQVEVNRRLNTGLPYEEGVTTAATATQAAEEYINYLRTYSTLQFTEATKLFAGWNAGPGWVSRNFPDSTDLEALPVETMRLMTRFMLSLEELTGGDWSQLSGLSDEWRSFVEDTADTVNRLVEEFGDKVSNQFPGGEPYTFDLSEVARRLEEIPEAAITPDINIETPAIEIPEAPSINVATPVVEMPETPDVNVEAPELEAVDFSEILGKLDEIKAIVQEFYVEPGIKGEEIKAILQEFYVEPDFSGVNENLSGIESAIDEVGKILGSLQFPITDLTGVIEAVNGIENETVFVQDFGPLLTALESLKGSIIEGNATLNSIFARLGVIRDKLWSFGGGFSSGGFTSGRKEEVAGVVHGGEWVAPKWLVESEPELFAKLESMRKGVPGYEVGGPVDIKIPVLRNFAEGGTVEMPDFVNQSLDMFKPIMTSMSAMFKGIMSVVVKVADAILNAVAKIIEALGGDSALVQDIKDAMKSLSKMADDIDSDLKEVFDLFGEVQGEMSAAAKIFEKAGQALGGPFGLPKGLGISEDAGIFERLFGGPFNSLRKKIEEIVSSLGLFEEQSNALKEQFAKVIASLMSGDVKGAAIGADSLVTGAVAMIPTIMEGIAAVFGGLEAMLGPVGAAIAVVTVGLGLLGGLLLKASGAIEAFKKGMDTTLSPVLARLARPFERLGNELGRVLIPVIEFLIPVIEALAAAVKGVINFVIDAINVAIDILNMIPFVNLEKLSRLGDLEQPEPEYEGGNLAGWHQPVTNNFNVTFTGNTVLDTDDEAMKQLWEKFLRYAREHGVEVVV
ncbi:MAG: hypothetical protein GXX80_10920 [Thermotogaceae bacterium]|nr:hypothetical protein [Thermotogaceae bacterium]